MILTKLADGRWLVEARTATGPTQMVVGPFELAQLGDAIDAAFRPDFPEVIALPTVEELAERYRKEWGHSAINPSVIDVAERALRLIRGDAA